MISPISNITNSGSSNSVVISKETNKEDAKLLSEIIKGELESNKASVKQTKTEDNAKNTEKAVPISYDALANKLKEILNDESVEIKFDKDDQTKQMVMKLVDKDTQKTVKQYPPEITIKIARMVSDFIDHGAITNAKA